jgi:hypothetical protein
LLLKVNDSEDNRSRINRTIFQLDSLYNSLSPQEFGRVMQQLLACTFAATKFRVIENTIGVPDFTATTTLVGGISETFAVEVKTTDKSKLSLTQRDLDGILTPGQTGILAVLMFPAITPRWLLISAGGVSSRSWEIRHLKGMPNIDVGFDVDTLFQQVVANLDTASISKGQELEGWIKGQRHSFMAKMSQPSDH